MTTVARPFFGRVETLRGLGALAVAAYHFTGYEWIPGRSALMTFFVISGFVLRVSLEYGPRQPGAAAVRFAVSRIFRIYPIVILSAIFILFNSAMLPAAFSPAVFMTDVRSFLAYVSLCDVRDNAVLWALQVEVLATPIIFAQYLSERTIGRHSLTLFTILATMLSFSSSWAILEHVSHNLFAIALGMLVPTNGREFAERVSAPVARLTAGGAFVALLLTGPAFGFYAQWCGVVEAYAAFLLICLFTYRNDLPGSAFLAGRFAMRLGRVSGSFYVLHILVWQWVVVFFATVLSADWQPLMALAGVIVMIPVALLGYAFVEAPGIALGRAVLGFSRPAFRQV